MGEMEDKEKINKIHIEICLLSGINPLSDKGKEIKIKLLELYREGYKKETNNYKKREPHVVY